MSETLRPLLKWVGGKTWLSPMVRAAYKDHTHRRMNELFCGGGGICHSLRPKFAVLNDANPHLINLYRQVQKGLDFGDFDTSVSKERFLKLRELFNRRVADGKVRNPRNALLFFYLVRTGYNGLCRFNRKGQLNMSYGGDKPDLADSFDLDEYREAWRNWTFTNLDFSECDIDKRDFIFADPPYDGQYDGYTGNPFTWERQVELAEMLAKHKGPVLATNNPTERIIDLYRSLGFGAKRAMVSRTVGCTNASRGKVKEVVFHRNIVK